MLHSSIENQIYVKEISYKWNRVENVTFVMGFTYSSVQYERNVCCYRRKSTCDAFTYLRISGVLNRLNGSGIFENDFVYDTIAYQIESKLTIIV